MNEDIKKIVELEIDLDNIELDGMGVQIVSFVEEPAIEVDFMAFSAQKGLRANNKGMEKFKEFLDANQDMMKKPGGGPAGDGGVDHGAQMKLLEEAGISTEYPFGYCFQIAQFLFYALGGYNSEWDLMCIKGMQYEVDKNAFQSTHWYVQSKEDGRIVDLSAEQFDGILDITQYYKDGRRANLGFPYYNVADKKVEFENTVPSMMTLKLYNKWREEHGELEGIEEFYQACQYEKYRMSMQFSQDSLPYIDESFVYPKSGEEHDPFMGRCISVLVGDEGYESSQAAAICHSYWEEEHGPTEMCADCFDLDEACWPGWEAIGLKPKNGRMVPNCVPVENNMQFESYNDYPESAKNAAKRALEWRDKNPDQGCGTRVGWTRANQLAKGENISEETIARMASFARHLQYKDVPYSEGCGGLMVDAWGGQAGIEWAQNKLATIREESDYNTGALSPYIDYGDELRKKESFEKEECYVMSEEEQAIVLKWAEENGEQITEDYTFLDTSKEFSSVGDIAKAIQGLDILGKLGVRQGEPAELKYKYTDTGRPAQRDFCRSMIRLNKLYNENEIITLKGLLSTVNPGMGRGGSNSYNVLAWKGGVNCTHFWSRIALFKPEGSRQVLMIDQGPADGPAGRSNNSSSPSPTGAVRNNASLRFSFSIANDEKRIVAGPLMIPNQFILRRDSKGNPYYVFFSKDTIRRIQERFNKNGFQNITDLDHDGEVRTDNILLEQWIIESRVHDKSRYYGYELLPTGTWFGTYKVNDEATWKKIKEGKLRGFSIMGDFIDKATPINNEEDTLSKIIDVLKDIK